MTAPTDNNPPPYHPMDPSCWDTEHDPALQPAPLPHQPNRGHPAMKIIACDNFARETVADRLVASNIINEQEANLMLAALLSTCTDNTPTWYRLEPDDYKLWRGMEELV